MFKLPKIWIFFLIHDIILIVLYVKEVLKSNIVLTMKLACSIYLFQRSFSKLGVCIISWIQTSLYIFIGQLMVIMIKFTHTHHMSEK